VPSEKLCSASPMPAASTPLMLILWLKALSRTLGFLGESFRGSLWRPPLQSLALGPRGGGHSLLCPVSWCLLMCAGG
jgi:hypothetical protein